MKKFKLYIFSLGIFTAVQAQETVYPAPQQTGTTVITNATIHVGNGQVLEHASIVMKDGKITAVGTSVTPPAGAQTIDAQGKHVYPGLILASSNLGLVEIGSVRASNDAREIC